MRHGVPYKGSKSRIADKIIDCLPPAEYFVDLFAGGCAVTHAAMLSGKYEKFIVNDIDGRGVRLFESAISGKFQTMPDEWISRERFLENASLPPNEQDPYIALCWSFGNNMKDYLYSKDIEEWKHAYHEAVFHGDLSLWKKQGFDAPECDLKEPDERRLFYQAFIMDCERGGGTRTEVTKRRKVQSSYSRRQTQEQSGGGQRLQREEANARIAISRIFNNSKTHNGQNASTARAGISRAKAERTERQMPLFDRLL